MIFHIWLFAHINRTQELDFGLGFDLRNFIILCIVFCDDSDWSNLSCLSLSALFDLLHTHRAGSPHLEPSQGVVDHDSCVEEYHSNDQGYEQPGKVDSGTS